MPSAGEAVGETVGEFGQLEPVVAAAAQLFGDAGDDEFVVAEGVVEGDGLGQGVVLDEVEGDVPAGAGETEFVDFGFEGGGSVLGRAGELDAGVAHFGDGSEGAGHIGGKFAANGVELEGDGRHGNSFLSTVEKR